jgi:hypothetical protein
MTEDPNKTSGITPDGISIRLTKNDLNRIFKWYDKGFTNSVDDKPLLDRLKKIYDEAGYG